MVRHNGLARPIDHLALVDTPVIATVVGRHVEHTRALVLHLSVRITAGELRLCGNNSREDEDDKERRHDERQSEQSQPDDCANPGVGRALGQRLEIITSHVPLEIGPAPDGDARRDGTFDEDSLVPVETGPVEGYPPMVEVHRFVREGRPEPAGVTEGRRQLAQGAAAFGVVLFRAAGDACAREDRVLFAQVGRPRS